VKRLNAITAQLAGLDLATDAFMENINWPNVVRLHEVHAR